MDLADTQATEEAVRLAEPDLGLHLAAESHVDRSISGPGAFLSSNENGTFSLLKAVRTHWEQLPEERQQRFRLHHISTDEVLGSLGASRCFSETTAYDPRSPYSASKATSDHLVNAWHHTYGLLGSLGRSYCVGGYGERTNRQIVELICDSLDQAQPKGSPHSQLIQRVSDRPGHDRRYAIDPSRIQRELGWQPRHSLEVGLAETVTWYLTQRDWCRKDPSINLSGFE